MDVFILKYYEFIYLFLLYGYLTKEQLYEAEWILKTYFILLLILPLHCLINSTKDLNIKQYD